MACERHAILNGFHKIILHSVENAINYYLKTNYNFIEKSYKKFDILQLYLMEKNLVWIFDVIYILLKLQLIFILKSNYKF